MKFFTPNELFKLSWLLAPEDDAVTLERDGPDLQRLPYAMPPEIGVAWLDSLIFPDGIVLYRAVHDMAPSPRGQLIPLMDVDGLSEEPAFNAQIWLSGLGCHHEYWQGRDAPPVEIVAFPGRDTFRYKRLWQAKVLVEGGVTSEMKSVVVPDSVMRALLGGDATDTLVSRLGLSAARQAVVLPMPLHVSAPLRDAMSGQFAGAARKLFAQARILDYLGGLLHFVLSDDLPPAQPASERKMDELRDHLVNLEGAMPTLIDLAKQFGVSARRLNNDFTAKHGQSIYSFVTEHRLAQAHALLLSEPIALKTLATRLGYSHVNQFSTAFKKRFGYPPGSLQRK
ncbi:MAG: AraC family transcriptional regulator [Rhodocyclaceae bacterium]|nr:AraC family transcriptional regulator [Rhodocyclaceae bacterium]